METRRLGRNGPLISVIGFGTWEAGGAQWGASVEDDVVERAMLAGLDAGMSWIDTAEAYGDGRAEDLVARVLRRRPETLVFTKVAPFASGIDPAGIRRAIEGSLRRLGRGEVDLYQIHWPDEERVPIEEAWGAMAEVRAAGLARAIGLSNVDRGLVERCLAVSEVDSVQNQLSLLHLEDHGGLLPWLSEREIGYLAYAPLAFGLLTGAIREDTEFDDDDWRGGRRERLGYYDELFRPGALQRSLARVEELRAIAMRAGRSLPDLALRAAVEVPGVTAAIVGTRSPEHAAANARAAATPLPEGLAEWILADLGSTVRVQA